MLRRSRVAGLLLAGVLGVVAVIALQTAFHKDRSMPPVLVYLLPAEFVGPVYVFFGQSDGDVPTPDPLGHAVKVPKNGVVKLQGSVDELLKPSSSNQRAEAMVMLRADGSRKLLKMEVGPHRNEDGESFWEGFIDENDQLHRFPVDYINSSSASRKSRFYFMSPEQMKERMVFGKSGCSEQGFVPNPGRVRSGEVSMDAAKVPSCAKFLVASPAEVLSMPEQLWQRPSRKLYESIQQFVDEANARVPLLEEFNALSKTDKP